MKNLCITATVLLFTSFYAAATPWNRLSSSERDFCEVHMAKALALYEAGGQDASIQSLEDSYDLADMKFSNSFFMHRIIWWEAQVRSGKANEAWGLKLFQFLRRREHELYPQHAIHIPGNDFVLYGNIIWKMENIGMLAQARAETLELEKTLTEHLGLDLTCESYADHGALFDFLPEARKRTYPIKRDDCMQYRRNATGCSRFIYYCYMYGLQDVSNIALASGDWKRAAELSDWFMQYNDAFAVSAEQMRGEVCRKALESTDMLADICQLHKQPEQAADLYETFIGKFESKQYTSSSNVCNMAKLKLARIQIQLGTLPQDSIAMAESAVAGISVWDHYDRAQIMHAKLSLARICHALGQPAQAWAIINTLFEETSLDINTCHQLRILTTAIDLAMDEGGTHPELEKWLVLALHNERQLGNKFRELPLYEKYAQFLAMNGRHDEARAIYREAIRLADAMDVPVRSEQNRLALRSLTPAATASSAQAPAKVGDTPVANQPTAEVPTIGNTEEPQMHTSIIAGTSVSAQIPVSIQPNLSLSSALKGHSAHGRFYLTNPAETAQTGQLEIKGRIDSLKWQNDQWLTLQASPEFPDVSASKPLRLQAGASCIIDITGLPADDGSGGSVRCSWMNGVKLISESRWDYRTSDVAKRTAVIDAHELKSNPFYLIPINHTVQRQSASVAEAIDFTVKATAPMRIEAYNGSTGKLLYVDANGDGDFLDSGDLISSDANHNNWPDIIFNAGDRMASLTLYVKPQADNNGEQELTVQVLEDGTWRIDAVDVVK
ncbi:hypothetical protein P4B35_14430 [Pontiellaceae bacterium B12227]|nr:hypothetical protein [Pontiellaceae bacterium B12227]